MLGTNKKTLNAYTLRVSLLVVNGGAAASASPLRQPLLESRAFILCPVSLAVAADGHILAAGSERVGMAALRLPFVVCASRFVDTAHLWHCKNQNTETRGQKTDKVKILL